MLEDVAPQFPCNLKHPAHPCIRNRDGVDAFGRAFCEKKMAGVCRYPYGMPAPGKIFGENEDVIFTAGKDAGGIGQKNVHGLDAVMGLSSEPEKKKYNHEEKNCQL
jgi:hypothetical protein